MKLLKKIPLILPILIWIIASAASGMFRPDPEDGPEKDRIARVERGLIPRPAIFLRGEEVTRADLAERMIFYRVPGVGIAVFDRNRIVWAKGYGTADAGTGSPVTPETLFQAASISKPIAAAAALVLVEKRLLDPDEDVNRRLVSWKVPENEFTAADKVTLRRLLSHTAGLTVHGFPGYRKDKILPGTVEILDGSEPANTDAVRVDLQPGTRYRYSGGGYTVMQLLLSDVLGRPFPEIMRRTVLDPLGMKRSAYLQLLPDNRRGEAAAAHLMNGRVVKGDHHVHPELAAAGLWTTPSELCLFAIDISRAYLGEQGRLLSPETARMMLTPQVGGFGLGLALRGQGLDFRFDHGGSNLGFRSQLIAYPNREQGAAVMTNGEQGGALLYEILAALAAEYGWPDFRPEVRDFIEIDPRSLQEMEGVYMAGTRTIRIVLEEGGLWIDSLWFNPGGWRKCRLHPENPTHFFATDDRAEVTFVRDEEGEVTALLLSHSGQKIEAKRIGPAVISPR